VAPYGKASVMALHLRLFILQDRTDLAGSGVSPLAVLTINEDMHLNRQIKHVGPRQGDVVPVVSPQPVLRGFSIEMTTPNDQT
jgi:hypothetical protein